MKFKYNDAFPDELKGKVAPEMFNEVCMDHREGTQVLTVFLDNTAHKQIDISRSKKMVDTAVGRDCFLYYNMHICLVLLGTQKV